MNIKKINKTTKITLDDMVLRQQDIDRITRNLHVTPEQVLKWFKEGKRVETDTFYYEPILRYEIATLKIWKHKKTSATASIHGVVPYLNEKEKLNWEIKFLGYTIKDNVKNIVGPRKVPLVTSEEAQKVVDRLNKMVNSSY